jgi:hypothetical protein
MSGIQPKENRPNAFRFREERQGRNYRRLDLIGKGPAAFYRDAHRLLTEEPLYESTVHVVSHLLREVESALRAVLLPYDFGQPEECGECGSKKEVHKGQIKAILTSLRFDDGDEAGKLWLKLTDRGDNFGLARKAHRDALAPPHRVDAGFYRMVSEIEAMLDAVLTKFEERFLSAVPLLEELLKTRPGKRAATRLQNDVPNNGILHGYFFQRLNDPAWLGPLRAKEFFSHPPDPVQDSERGITTFPSWPEARYLERMAALDSPGVKRTVLDIALTVETDNPTVYIDLTKAALRMPPEMQAEWARKMTTWLGREVFIHPLLPEQLGNLASGVAEGGFTDAAVALLRALLAPRTDAQEGDVGLKDALRYQPRPRFNLWRYARIIRKNVPALTNASGRDALTLLCDLLDDALRLSRSGDGEDEGLRDYWRPAIESDQRGNSLLDPLVSGVRDVAQQAAADPSQVPAVVEILERRRFRIFKRLSLYLLRSFPEAAPRLTAGRLTDKSYFEDHGLRREYDALLKSCFARLEERERALILGWVAEGPRDVEDFKEGFEGWYGRQVTEPDVDEYVGKWKLERLDPFREVLTGEWKEFYEALKRQYGRQEADTDAPYDREAKGRVSPKSAEELGGMGLDEVVSYLESWQPSEGPEGFSIRGLESSLREAVVNAPELFSRSAERFKALRLNYVRALISGLSSEVDQKRPIDWGPVIGLCLSIAAEPISLPAEDAAPAERDRLLAQIKHDSASLLGKGMRDDSQGIADELSGDVFELLRSLIRNLPRVGAEQLGDKRRSIAESVISARASALEEVIRYASWVSSKRREEAAGSTVARQGEALGELREILDLNLDTGVDPDLRLRKIYGEYFPLLVSLDSAWASRNIAHIFPTGEAGRRLFDAAWQSYILYGQYYIPAFDLLQEQYRVAIERLGPEPAGETSGADPGRQLALHVMVFYGRGKSSLDDEGSLVNRFFAFAGPALRASAVGFIGEDLRGTEGGIDAEILSRLQALWAKRFDAARGAASPDDHKDEMAAFGWWFASGKFDEEWSLQQLREVLLLVRQVDGDDFVVERLAALAPKYPIAAVECLALMIEGDEERYGLEMWKDPAQELLRAALKHEGDDVARREATVLINRISARGAIDYAFLLPELAGVSR